MREPITILIVNQLEACLARVLAVRRTSSRIMVLRADKRNMSSWASGYRECGET